MSHKHATDRVDGSIVAECPNVDEGEMHLSVEIDYETADDDDVLADLLDGFPECDKCGEPLEYVQIEEPTEVLD